MPTWANVIIVIAIIGVVAVAAMVGTGVYLWKQYGPQFVAGVEQGAQEGKAFGGKTDNQGCVDEGVRRHRQAAGISDFIKSGVFMQGCLEASRETPGFCDGVPDRLQFIKSVTWREEQCAKHGLGGQQDTCGKLFEQVQRHCERRR